LWQPENNQKGIVQKARLKTSTKQLPATENKCINVKRKKTRGGGGVAGRWLSRECFVGVSVGLLWWGVLWFLCRTRGKHHRVTNK